MPQGFTSIRREPFFVVVSQKSNNWDTFGTRGAVALRMRRLSNP
jgi:hypothetical protein